MVKIYARAKRNQELERELQEKILSLLANPRYEGLPMLVMFNLDVRDDKGGVEIEAKDTHFILIGNYFSDKLEREL